MPFWYCNFYAILKFSAWWINVWHYATLSPLDLANPDSDAAY